MRARWMRIACGALAVAALALGIARLSRAADEKPVPPAPAWVCTRPPVPALPENPTARDLRDHPLRAELRTLQCQLDVRRDLEVERQETCYFGPEIMHIPAARYDEIRAAHKDDPVELWHALLSEPEDPNARPITVRVNSKSGPNCDDDIERKLEDRIDAIEKELNFR